MAQEGGLNAGADDPAWDHSTFSKNRDRLLDGDIAARFLSAVLAQPRVRRLLSTEHFGVDGTLIDAWAEQLKAPPMRSIGGKAAEGSVESFRPKGDPGPPMTAVAGARPRPAFAARSARTRRM